MKKGGNSVCVGGWTKSQSFTPIKIPINYYATNLCQQNIKNNRPIIVFSEDVIIFSFEKSTELP